MPWHAAVVGTGGWSRVHLAALTVSPHVEAVTLVGRNEQARTALAGEFPIVRRTTSDLDSVLNDDSVEVVHVVLPHDLHTETSLAALAAGKHVICEKPAALSLADFDRTARAARARQRRYLVTLNQLYNPVVLRIRELVEEGALGRVFLAVENAYSSAADSYRDAGAWRTTLARAGGGVLIDGGFHMVYRHLFYLGSLGQPQWVAAQTDQLNVSQSGAEAPQRGEDFVSIVVGYDAPLRIQWAHAWTLASEVERARQCFLAGSRANLELTDDAQQPLILHEGDKRRAISVAKGPHSPRETTHICLLDYLDCLASGHEPEHANLPLSRTALCVILAAYESGRSGRRVPIEPNRSSG